MLIYNKKQKGFTLIELIVAVGVFMIIIGIPYAYFTKELKHTVKESTISQSALEDVPSLEILRKDIQNAGYGLVWDTTGITYTEASSSTNPPLYSSTITPASFNDASNPPRAIIGKTDTAGHKFSYLVLKGASLGLNKASKHWSYIDNNSKLNIWPTTNSANYSNLQKNDRVIVMDAGSRRIIIDNSSGNFYFTISKDADPNDKDPSDYINWSSAPHPQSVYLIYGINRPHSNSPIAPFNRVDYYLYNGGDTNSECAVGTHTLGRAVMRQSDGVMNPYPLLHCVADFQVGFGLDTTKDRKIDTWTQDITNKNAADIRNQLKQVRFYILVQNGTKDRNYSYPNNSIYVGDNSIGIGRNFDFTDVNNGFRQTGAKSYKHYRWKLIKLIVKPMNLGVSK